MNRGRSGQVLAVSALVIALIITSTAGYIYELSGNIGDGKAQILNDYVGSIRLGSLNTVIGALANVTNGGQNETLADTLNAWSATVGHRYTLGTFALAYELRNVVPYSSGLCLNWGSDGSGVSVAYTDFALNVTGKEIEMYYPYSINISTMALVEGHLDQVGLLTKQATVLIRLFNEGQPALAQNVTVYYEELGLWLASGMANGYALSDYGNGTYRITFTVETLAASLNVSVHALDTRSIFVRANATLTEE